MHVETSAQGQPVSVDVTVGQSTAPSTAGELDLFSLALTLVKSIWFIAACSAIAFLIMVGIMLHAKPRYASTAVMLVPQGNRAAASLQAELSINTLDLLGGGFELYADIMKSRTIGDRLIKNHDLMKVYGVKRLQDAENILNSVTRVETLPEGIVRVTVQDGSPQRAADLANDYLQQLDILNSNLVLTSAGEEREYLEREMVREKNTLADAEVALKEVQESTSGLAPDAIANAGLGAVESTRAQLRADQIHLDALLQGETEANPEVVRLRSEIAGLSSQVETLQLGETSTLNGTPTTRVPAQELEYTRRLREVKFHESLFDLLEKQYEAAKEQEAKTRSIVQVLDPAVPSDSKAWPPRTYYCLMAAVVGAVAGIFLVGFRTVAVAYLRAARNREHLEELKAASTELLPWTRRRRNGSRASR